MSKRSSKGGVKASASGAKELSEKTRDAEVRSIVGQVLLECVWCLPELQRLKELKQCELAEVQKALVSPELRVVMMRALATALLVRLPSVMVAQLDRALTDKGVAKEILSLAEVAGVAPVDAGADTERSELLPLAMERALVAGLREAMGFAPEG